MSHPERQPNVIISEDDKRELRQALSERLKAIATMLADSVLLAIWAVSTWLVNVVLTNLALSEVLEKATIQAFQWIFAISTLTPVLAYTVVDICKVLKHAWAQIRKG